MYGLAIELSVLTLPAQVPDSQRTTRRQRLKAGLPVDQNMTRTSGRGRDFSDRTRVPISRPKLDPPGQTSVTRLFQTSVRVLCKLLSGVLALNNLLMFRAWVTLSEGRGEVHSPRVIREQPDHFQSAGSDEKWRKAHRSALSGGSELNFPAENFKTTRS